MSASRPDLFGRTSLGYLVVDSRRLADWRRFGADALGLHVDELTRDTLRFRIDHHACRLLVTRSGPDRGTQEDVTAIGWQADSHEVAEALVARARDAGLPVTDGTEEECALRGVERLHRFPGPHGLATEVFTTPVLTPAPLRMLQTAFVTGDAGMGHVALTARRPDTVREYFDRVFDARLSDWVHERIAGLPLRIRFLRVNERHHSIAVAGLHRLPLNPVRTRIQHLNTEVAVLDDLLSAYERVIDHGFRMQWNVGQHTNDRELSFYCSTPSGFEWELGWNPVVVTPEREETWAPRTYEGISIWGHTPIGENVLSRLTQVRHAAASLGHTDLPELAL